MFGFTLLLLSRFCRFGRVGIYIYCGDNVGGNSFCYLLPNFVTRFLLLVFDLESITFAGAVAGASSGRVALVEAVFRPFWAKLAVQY